jgi:hypothetical protein
MVQGAKVCAAGAVVMGAPRSLHGPFAPIGFEPAGGYRESIDSRMTQHRLLRRAVGGRRQSPFDWLHPAGAGSRSAQCGSSV